MGRLLKRETTKREGENKRENDVQETRVLEGYFDDLFNGGTEE